MSFISKQKSCFVLFFTNLQTQGFEQGIQSSLQKIRGNCPASWEIISENNN